MRAFISGVICVASIRTGQDAKVISAQRRSTVYTGFSGMPKRAQKCHTTTGVSFMCA
jgi:hypothetical protein